LNVPKVPAILSPVVVYLVAKATLGDILPTSEGPILVSTKSLVEIHPRDAADEHSRFHTVLLTSDGAERGTWRTQRH
jgi:hypothetical protein